jgi:hypothetical protein
MNTGAITRPRSEQRCDRRQTDRAWERHIILGADTRILLPDERLIKDIEDEPNNRGHASERPGGLVADREV